MNNKPKVLMIGSDTSVTGGMSSVIELYNEYNIFNDYAFFLASYKRGSVLFRIFFFINFLFIYIWELITVKSLRIVHVHSSYKGSFFRKAIVLFIAKLFRKKTIFHLHGSEFLLFYKNLLPFLRRIVQKTLNNTDLIIVLSVQWEDAISKISSKKNIKVLYNPTVIKESEKIPSGTVNILFMGVLCKRKGVYDIIEASKLIKNDNVIINLYGDGELEEFEKLVEDCNLQDRVKIKGWISGSQKEEVFRNSDIYILPSYNEGLPMSILEAMAFKLPIISTPIGGIPESIIEGVNGFLIQPGDSKSLAEKINLLSSDLELRARMGQKSYELAKEKFDITSIINQLHDIYDDMLKEYEPQKTGPQKKIYIMLEDDWELKGNGLGNVNELQYLPALFLMDLCEKLNIKMTFMVDVAQQLIFSEHQDNQEIKAQKDLWDYAVCLMKKRGFDVQLHLHPQWLNARYDGGFFYVNENWNIGTYDNVERKQLIEKSTEYLKVLINQIDPDYEIHSFKPGSWAIQPSEGVLNDLSNSGIKLIIGIKKDFYSSDLKIDFRNLEEDTHPYYPDFKDITKVSGTKNNIVVMPLLHFSPNLLTLFKLLFNLLNKKLNNKILSKSLKINTVPSKIKNLKLFHRRQLRGIFRPYITHVKIGNQPFEYLKKSFDDSIKRLESIDIVNIPVVIESHTKDYIGNYDNVEKFLCYIVEEYKDRVIFITLSDFINKIENNEFVVKYKE